MSARARVCVQAAYLLMGFSLNIFPVHLHHSVPRAQSWLLGWRRMLHFADVLAGFSFLSVQVKPVAILTFGHAAKPRFQVARHAFRFSIQKKKKDHARI